MVWGCGRVVLLLSAMLSMLFSQSLHGAAGQCVCEVLVGGVCWNGLWIFVACDVVVQPCLWRIKATGMRRLQSSTSSSVPSAERVRSR